VERYTPMSARVRARRETFCFWNFFFNFGGSSEAAMGGGGEARSDPFDVLMSPKRRVRAAHGRARAARTH
jgi:hypothetical protein